MEITSLHQLDKYRTAPKIDNFYLKKLLIEIHAKIKDSDWLTIGIMAESDTQAKNALISIKNNYPNLKFTSFEKICAEGNVFLKANQKTGEVYIRSENGLGQGILLTCHYDEEFKDSSTYGPFPLNFFSQ